MSKLALLRDGKGRVRGRKEDLPYSKPTITTDDKRAVIKAMDSGWIAGSGPANIEFENAIAEYTGYRFAITFNSASTALVAAYRATFGTEKVVNMPALTFLATSLAALEIGKRVTFADVHHESFVNDSPDLHVGVSYAGYPVFNPQVIDDAHSLYPKMGKDKGPGHYCSVLSTHAVKHITTGEGGVLLTNSTASAELAKRIRNHGRVRAGGEATMIGNNWRMPSMNAALGLSQLLRHNELLARRRQLAEEYMSRLVGTPLRLPIQHEKHSWHIFVTILPEIYDRNLFRRALRAEGIITQVHYPPPYRSRVKKLTANLRLPNTNLMADRGMTIPLFAGMTDSDQADVIAAIHKVFEYYDDLSIDTRKRQ